MHPIAELVPLVTRELKKTFRSVRGIILALFTAAIGSGIALLVAALDEARQRRLSNVVLEAEAAAEVKRTALQHWFLSDATGASVAAAPMLLFVCFAVSLNLMPGLVAMMGFDGLAGECQHKTVRYWALRVRRESFVVSKLIGLWLSSAIVLLVMNIVIWGIAISKGESAALVIGWGIKLWLSSLPILAVWCALSVAVSSAFRAPVLALLTTSFVTFLWWMFSVPGWFRLQAAAEPHAHTFEVPARLYLYPNFYDRFLLSPEVASALFGCAACFGFAAVLAAGTSLYFARKDI